MFSSRYFKSGSSTSHKRGFSKVTSELTCTHCHFWQPLPDINFRKYFIISRFKWSFKKVTQNVYRKTLRIWNNSTSSPAPLLKKVPYNRSHRKAPRWVLSISREGDFCGATLHTVPAQQLSSSTNISGWVTTKVLWYHKGKEAAQYVWEKAANCM